MISAHSNLFGNSVNTTPMIIIGNPGDEGIVEISDIIISTQGQVPWAILVQWNIKDSPGHQGESGM